jgi:para-nitrobenzyl esterase
VKHTTRPVVDTLAGAVRGLRDAHGERFHAIPYAAAPLGTARFTAPAPHAGWKDIRDACQPGATAPQPGRDFGRLDMSPYFGPGWVAGDEYLTVDVYTPDSDDSNRPVMVFVHGGGFVTGSSRAALYDGRAFARDGIVLVTLNYRLGIPGFLDLHGAPANRGLLDILAALDWVQNNISSFGGDPSRVTVFGQSAGATLIGALLATPEAGGLFQNAIMQSGSGIGAFNPEQAQRVTKAAATVLGADATAESFARIADDDFVAVLPKLAGLDLRTESAIDPLQGLSPFSVVLPGQPADSLANGPAADVNLLIGTNAEEGHLYLAPQGNLDASELADVAAAAARAHADPQPVVDKLIAQRPHATAGELRSEVLGDALFGTGTRRMAEAHTRLGARATYVYGFDFRSSALDGKLGAAHTVELPFVFDVVEEPWLHGDTGLLGPHPAPRALADEMHGAWVTFARTGSPGWPAYDLTERTVRHYGK